MLCLQQERYFRSKITLTSSKPLGIGYKSPLVFDSVHSNTRYQHASPLQKPCYRLVCARDVSLLKYFGPSFAAGELYGEFNLMTSEWTDGLVPKMVRQCVQAGTEGSDNRK